MSAEIGDVFETPLSRRSMWGPVVVFRHVFALLNLNMFCENSEKRGPESARGQDDIDIGLE